MQLSCWPRSVLFSIRNEFLRVKDYFQEGPDQPIRADLDTAELLTKVLVHQLWEQVLESDGLSQGGTQSAC